MTHRTRGDVANSTQHVGSEDQVALNAGWRHLSGHTDRRAGGEFGQLLSVMPIAPPLRPEKSPTILPMSGAFENGRS